MTPEERAALHARAFTGAARPWTPDEFRALGDDPFVLTLDATGQNGFLILRLLKPEAEVLTLCTAPDARRQGIARALMDRAHADLTLRGITRIFLEVAEDNLPARALYAALGYTPAGIRKNYYRPPRGDRVHAHVLCKNLPSAT